MRAYLELCKPRITFLVLVTTAIGWWLGGGREGLELLWTLSGTVLAACAAASLNQWAEREADARMRRTASRPLPQGRVRPAQAFLFGCFCALAGLSILYWKVNWQAAALAAFTMFLYLAVYTPLKKRTPLSTWFGAVAGATPPLIGWAGGHGYLEPQALALFAIQFLWQIPHFLTLFWTHREDYARAGFKVMPVVDTTGAATAYQIAIHSFAVVPASLLPGLLGMVSLPYSAAMLLVGAAYMSVGLKTSWTLSLKDTRRLFRMSLVYLPSIFTLIILGEL